MQPEVSKDEIIWKSIAPCPPFKTPPPQNFHLIMFGNDLMEIGLNWLGSSCRKDFRSICGNIQYFAKWRKFQKIQENLSKIKNSLRSVFIAAWPELVQFNCGNFLVCLCLFFTNKEKNKISFCLFLCLWKRARQTLVSRPKYWLWLAGAALGYSMEMREFFQKNFEIGFFQGFVPESKTYFSLWPKRNCKQQLLVLLSILRLEHHKSGNQVFLLNTSHFTCGG